MLTCWCQTQKTKYKQGLNEANGNIKLSEMRILLCPRTDFVLKSVFVPEMIVFVVGAGFYPPIFSMALGDPQKLRDFRELI